MGLEELFPLSTTVVDVVNMTHFETSSKNGLYNANDSMSVQVAFIVAGCTHTTYYKTLKHALGIDAQWTTTFQSTIKQMFPVVQEMVDRMCEEAKIGMKTKMSLMSLSRAVTFLTIEIICAANWRIIWIWCLIKTEGTRLIFWTKIIALQSRIQICNGEMTF